MIPSFARNFVARVGSTVCENDQDCWVFSYTHFFRTSSRFSGRRLKLDTWCQIRDSDAAMIALPRWRFAATSPSKSAVGEYQSTWSTRVRLSAPGLKVRCAATASERAMEERALSSTNGASEALLAKMEDLALEKKSDTPPLFSFGVITDIQYADIPDGRSFLGVPRYYRHALAALRRAVDAWNTHGSLSFAVQFGDIVDGYCPEDDSRAAFERVLAELARFEGGRVYHMVGNHCLYNLPRPSLNHLFQIKGDVSYYSFSPHPSFLFVILDGYDVSALGWPDSHPHTKTALEILQSRNPNEEKNSPEGLVGVERRFVKFNGGVGDAQLAWLERSLQEATDSQQRVILCCHLPLEPGVAFPSTLLWNYEAVMEVVHRFQCVVACFGGHAHDGGHFVDAHGVHHHVLEAVLECPPGRDAFGFVEVHEDRLRLCGTDRMESIEMFFL